MSRLKHLARPWLLALAVAAVVAISLGWQLSVSARVDESTAQELSTTAADGTVVSIRAERGVLSEGASVEATLVHRPAVIDAVTQAVESEGGKASHVKAIDVTLRNAAGETIQPNGTLEVTFSQVNMGQGDVSVYHVTDEGAGEEPLRAEEVRTSKAETGEQVFETNHFSIYAVVSGQNPIRDTYVFQNGDGSPFQFKNMAGTLVDNQIIKDNEPLQDVGLPNVPAGTTFRGWYLFDPATGQYGDKVKFGEAFQVGSSSDTHYVRAYFGDVAYVVFYEDSAGGVVLTSEQVPIDGNDGLGHYDASQNSAVIPSADLAFVGWSTEPGTDDDERVPLAGADTKMALAQNETAYLYPVFKRAHWIRFFVAPSGSDATGIAPAFVLSGKTAEPAEPAQEPSWPGHTFVGWYDEPDDNYENDSSHENGSRFDFSRTLSENETACAHWRAAEANYTVIYWRQNVTDDKYATDSEKTYAYAGQKNHSAVVGTTAYLTEADKAAGASTASSSMRARRAPRQR